ncbi:MAG: DUF4369 domain-containing protein [Candidatus Cryptobacteroides sp.]
MSRLLRFLPAVLALSLAVSCSDKATVKGTLAQAPSSEVIVKVLDVNRLNIVDTVAVGSDGRFACKVAVPNGQPEFVYIFYGDRKIASLLLERGDKVTVDADTLGNFTVAGSEESVKLAAVEKDYADVEKKFSVLSEAYASAGEGSAEAAEIRRQMGQEYVAYYRSRVKYIMENSHSLTVVPVFYQKIGNLPVFGQSTDAIHFTNICDSLETVYPDSKYVKALRAEARDRNGYLELETRLRGAEEIGYPDITLPDVNAAKIQLSSVDAKVIMVQFWSAAEAAQKMFNLDVLKPVYDEYHKKGFEIYQVSLDADKALWARVVKEQKLPWISVCDSRASASPYVTLYNIPGVPATYIISDGALVDGKVIDTKSLRKLLDRLLKQ